LQKPQERLNLLTVSDNFPVFHAIWLFLLPVGKIIKELTTMKIMPRFLLVLFLLLAMVSPQEALAGSPTPGGTVPVCGNKGCNATYVAPYVGRVPVTASASHAFTATGGSRVIDIYLSQEARDYINAAGKEKPLPLGCSTAADRAKAIARQPPLYGWTQNEIRRPSSHYSRAPGVLRNSHGRIQRRSEQYAAADH
jgi:hypothetical protein